MKYKELRLFSAGRGAAPPQAGRGAYVSPADSDLRSEEWRGRETTPQLGVCAWAYTPRPFRPSAFAWRLRRDKPPPGGTKNARAPKRFTEQEVSLNPMGRLGPGLFHQLAVPCPAVFEKARAEFERGDGLTASPL